MARAISTDGADWRKAIDLLELRVDRATRQGSAQAAHIVERAVKRRLSVFSHPPGTPTPSQAGWGAPPAQVTGALMRSVHASSTRRRRRGVYDVEVGPTVVYARIQELGGRAGRNRTVRLASRPYQKPATRAELVKIRSAYVHNWREAITL